MHSQYSDLVPDAFAVGSLSSIAEGGVGCSWELYHREVASVSEGLVSKERERYPE